MSEPNKILEEKDSSGVPRRYFCDYHLQKGNIDTTAGAGDEISSYYEALHSCSTSIDVVFNHVSTQLLDRSANVFNMLPEGTACTVPQFPVWVIGVSSLPQDSVVENLSCRNLKTTSSDQCCSVVHAPMTFWPTDSNFKETDIMDILATEIDSGRLTKDTDYQIKYIGSQLENLPVDVKTNPPRQTNPPRPTTGVNEAPKQTQQAEQNNFTVVGGVILGGLIAVFVGAFAVLIRRRHRAKTRDVDAAVQKSSDPELGDGQNSEGPTLEVDVMSMSDDILHDVSQVRNSFEVHDEYQQQQQQQTPSSYTFDLADSMKNDVMATYGNSQYGPTSISVVPPYPMMEETSDSEVDSWAQTDGTVGSLEERLEEITAEI